VEEYSITWIEKEIEGRATSFLKKWAGLTRSANVHILYLPQRNGGLNLPSLTSIYKRLQVSKACQLLTSADPTVRRIAEKNLLSELSAKRRKFLPAVVVQQVMQTDPDRSRPALVAAAKGFIRAEENDIRCEQLHNLPKQGRMLGPAPLDSAGTWSIAIQSLPQNLLKFVLNACLDTLPHNRNLFQWKKRQSASCLLCQGDHQNLIHILNSCKKALQLRRYNERHDMVLEVIASAVKRVLPTTMKMSVDIGEGYTFPSHISPTDLRPDIALWDDTTKSVTLIELTVCFEHCFEDARERKVARYADLLYNLQRSTYTASLITLEVGSRGLLHMPGFNKLSSHLHMDKKQSRTLYIQTACEAIKGLYKI